MEGQYHRYMITLPLFFLTTITNSSKKQSQNNHLLEEVEKVKKSYVHIVRSLGAVLTGPVE